jgi:DNA-binding CsgD family transcriptional regulator/tetratricopeptide (TPR) repeat protein
MATLTGGAFVGRQREMGKLKAILEDALSGQGQLLMLVGEPGIGKTRTAQELAAHAEARGAQVLWGWCYEEEGAPPFWPWLQPIRSYVQQRDPEQLQSEMGPGAADVAEVISEVRGKLPGLEPPPALQPEQARFRLFDSITTFLKNAAQSQPLMLVLDDLHWADKSSLLLLQFLARHLEESHLLVVGCYRDLELSRQHPLSEALAQLSRLTVFQRELLLGISQEDSGQFIEMTAGIRPSPQLVETIHAHTEGNPFFLKEMTRLLSEQGDLRAAEIGRPEGIRIPQGVREVIGRRLNRLSASCHRTLIIGSIIGREFDFRLLRTLSDETIDEQLLGVIDEALTARLIEELPGGREWYRFSHALIQQALAEGLSSSRKVRWHARIGEALEELYGADGEREIHAAELVYHFTKSESVIGPDKLIQYSLLAGEEALKVYAHEEALAHFQRGLEAKGVPLEGNEPARDAEEAALLFGLGRARTAMAERQQLQRAVDIMTRAFDYYEKAGDVARAIALAEYPQPIVAVGRTGIAQFIPRALKLVPPASSTAGRLLSSYGAELGRIEKDYERAQEAFSQALTIARQEKDVALEVRTLAASANMDLFRLHLPEVVEKSRQIIQLAPCLDDHQAAWLWSAHEDAARALELMGEIAAAQEHASAALELAEKLKDHYRLILALRVSITLYRHLGDWERARDSSSQSLAVASQDNSLLSERVLLEYQSGDFGQGEVFLERLLRTASQEGIRPEVQNAYPAVTIPWVARITREFGPLEIAATLAQSILSSPLSNSLSVLHSRAGLGILAVLRGDTAEAREQYEFLESQQGFMSAAISTDHLLGLLAHVSGDLDNAYKHCEDALAFCRRASLRPELAWVCHDYAEILLAGADGHASLPGARAKALSLLNKAVAIACELGMRPLMERVQSLQEKLAVRPGSAPVYPDGLSQREVEVLRLVALGKSNRDVSEELVISLRTVVHHVTSILNKTGAANRTEAAAYAARHGLVSWSR